MLIDTGWGPGVAPTVGLLAANLAAAGIDPKAIDIVIMSRLRPDHTNGIRSADGGLAFPNAEIKVPAQDWAFYYLSERRYGTFQRSFYVPEGVDADKIEASFKNGVLTVTLPKSAEAQQKQRQIAVKKG